MDNSEQHKDLSIDYPGESKVERIVCFGQANATFGVDRNDLAYALLEGYDNSVAYPLYGKDFKKWLQYQAYSSVAIFLRCFRH